MGDGIGLVGLIVLGYGLFQFSPALGFVYVGLALVGVAYVLESPAKAHQKPPTE